MGNEMFGLNPRKGEKHPSEELEEKIGIDFISIDREPYSSCIGEVMEVFVGSAKFSGVYRGINKNGDMVLCPHLAVEYYPRGHRLAEKPYFNWSEKPLFINERARIGFLPVRKEYLEKLIAQDSKEDKPIQERENSQH